MSSISCHVMLCHVTSGNRREHDEMEWTCLVVAGPF